MFVSSFTHHLELMEAAIFPPAILINTAYSVVPKIYISFQKLNTFSLQNKQKTVVQGHPSVTSFTSCHSANVKNNMAGVFYF